jgi:NCS2 family nucleobase:cation symporter-2
VTLIGLALLPIAANWARGGNPAAPEYGAPAPLALAFVTFALVVLFARVFRGFLRTLAVLLGLGGGTLVAAALGHVDASGVASAPWLALVRPFAFGPPRFEPGAIAAMLVVMLVTVVETTGDFVAVGAIVGRPPSAEDLARGVRADGLATMLGGILNAFPYTAYAQNVGLVGLTGVKSRFVVATAGAWLVVLGLVPKVAALVAAIPAPVLGGAAFVMFGAVASSGIRMLRDKVRFRGTKNGIVVAATLAMGLVPAAWPELFRALPDGLAIVLRSSITLGTLAAIVANALVGERAP